MSLDGLRAWIGEVERKLRMRTRVFLALAVIAIGGAGAAIYLAIDTRDNAVSEGDVRTLQEKLEARIGTGGAVGAGGVAQLEAELRALQGEVAQLRGRGGASSGGGGQGSSSGGGSGQGGSSGGGSGQGGSSGGGAATGGGANGGASSGSAGGARLEELLQKTKEEAEKAEGK